MTSALPVLEAMGFDGRMGLRLHQVFRDAGLPAPHMWMHAPIGCESGWLGWEYLSDHVRMVGSLAAGAGVELRHTLESASLGGRICDQVLGQHGVLRLQRGVQAWPKSASHPAEQIETADDAKHCA